ncbi:hypothetical protein PtA15_10A630 [Puccinia triticina]|uniref:Uncharacterized protein n=1 Tax=Puccinia triticina TaxID=208348 RepID=A0ABY7CVE1_9BASI|nr:uncharacterized protein PtA15_10A630 [Puccinia triticina]WAQ89206.1 hypothetical protein PtA15_10A630 [Puccinia triticina]WAR59258.1 hypothetical protein PtB15_10B600 [Puccinia triticina]
MLFRKNSNKATRSPKAASGAKGIHYDCLLGISYFDLNKESKRSKAMSKSSSKSSNSTTPLSDVANTAELTTPEPARSFVLIAVVGLPAIDLSDWFIVDSAPN